MLPANDKLNDMPTPFQKRVYAALAHVPRRRVTTYKKLAECPDYRSCRAVGQALKRNPYAPQVPCHRVIASDLTPGGFMGRRGGAALRRKLDLLAEEGVQFHAGKLAEPNRIFVFPDHRPHVDLTSLLTRAVPATQEIPSSKIQIPRNSQILIKTK